MDFAVKENRVLIEKRDSVMKGLLRQPAQAKERWGLEVEHIVRFEPEVEGQMELFSEEDSEQIHEYYGKCPDSNIFRPTESQVTCDSMGFIFSIQKCPNSPVKHRSKQPY